MYVHVFLSKKRRRGHGIGKARPGTNEAPSRPRTRCWRSFLKKGKREMEAICTVYRSMFVYCRYLWGGTLVPWHIVVSGYLVLVTVLLLQHVRANKASLQTPSVSSLVLPLHQLLRVDQHIDIDQFVNNDW